MEDACAARKPESTEQFPTECCLERCADMMETEETRFRRDDKGYIRIEDRTVWNFSLRVSSTTTVCSPNMKSSYLLASLALGSTTLARLIPRAELDNRQWTCRWAGHCLGDECETNRDCDGDLICRNYECANPGSPVKPTTTKKTTTTIKTTARPTNTVPPGCVWPGHCLGDPCDTENDCDADWICLAGKCTTPGPTIPIPIPTTTRQTTTSTIRPPVPPTTTTRVGPPPIITTTRPIPPPITTTRTTARPTTTTKPPTNPGNPSCGDNPLACIGFPCSTDADCKFDLIICQNGVCGL